MTALKAKLPAMPTLLGSQITTGIPMVRFITPGPVCATRNRQIDSGTMSLIDSPVPGFKGITATPDRAKSSLSALRASTRKYSDSIEPTQQTDTQVFLSNTNIKAFLQAILNMEGINTTLQQGISQSAIEEAAKQLEQTTLQALEIIQAESALTYVISGDLPKALSRVHKRWASLPVGPEQKNISQQSALAYEKFVEQYKAAGGTLKAGIAKK